MDMFGFASIASVAVIVEVIALIYKNLTSADNKWLPVICFVSGAILGVLAWMLYPDVYIASDIFTAIAIGIASGAVPVAGNEAITQLITKTAGKGGENNG